MDHECKVLDIEKVTETKTNYVCSICKRIVATSDIEVYGFNVVVKLDIPNHENKIYPQGKDADYDLDNQKLWI